MNRTITLALIVLGCALTPFLLTSQEKGQDAQDDTTPFMQRKLKHSQEIVSGLATEDYEKISNSAQDLMLLSHDAEWKVLTTKEYLQMSREFRDSAGRLRDAGKNKNLDGATLAYFEVTLSCVRCHKYIRQQ